MSPSKHFGQDKASCKEAVKPAWGVHSGDFITRPDSIGESGVQVPYVSRIRRCRPRKSIMALTKFNSSDIALNRKIVDSSAAVGKPQPDDHTRAKLVETKLIPFEEPVTNINYE